jgi:hypothetical protein
MNRQSLFVIAALVVCSGTSTHNNAVAQNAAKINESPIPVAEGSLNTTPLPPNLSDDDVLIIVPGGETSRTPAAPQSRASVGGVSVVGLSDVEAALRIRQTFAPLLEKKVAFTDGRDQYLLTRRDLGITIPAEKLIAAARKAKRDVPVDFKVDGAKAGRVITRLSEQLVKDGKTRGEVVDVSFNASLARVITTIEQGQEVRPANGTPGVTYIPLVLRRTVTAVVQPPPIPTKAPPVLPAKGAPQGMSYLLSQFSTPYDARIRGRTNNLRMAATNVNGTIVPPGGVFSTNKAIGPRNAAAGWREAKMFVSGQVVSGIGAGICQCSTTIYNAALLAGLPILERHQHMFRVNYAPASRDAAIYWGSKDMRFRNSTRGPILVRTYLKGGRFHAELYGSEPVTARIAVESQILSRKGGTRSTAHRTITDASGTRRERLSRDFYRPHP